MGRWRNKERQSWRFVAVQSRVSSTSHFSLKFREENEVGLVFWIGPGVALEILRL